MKAIEEKIREECNMSRVLRDGAWEEQDYKKSQEMRKEQQWHWEKFNFMKELSKALEREVKE